jgi:uncharacterized alpha/beta hydrolase family protein
MTSEPENLKLNIEDWNIKIKERSKQRMKLQVKLSKDEAVAFKNFADTCKPVEVSDEDFVKVIFVTGFETLNRQLAEMVSSYAKENKEELASSGITVLEDEDGAVTLEDSTAQGENEDA